MRKFVAVSAPILVVVAAIAFGYLHYTERPTGDLFYTPVPGICPTYSHSFTTGYSLVLLVGFVVWLAACMLFWLMSRFASKQELRSSLRRGIRPALLGSLFLAASWLAHPLFERALPLRDSPCITRGP